MRVVQAYFFPTSYFICASGSGLVRLLPRVIFETPRWAPKEGTRRQTNLGARSQNNTSHVQQ